MKEDQATLQEAIGSRYRLTSEIGRGGMATVYLAEDTGSGSLVAVKVLRRELTVILGSTRFHREIEILTRLRHPNIVPVLDSREAGSRLYYVMPYVSGDSLRARLLAEGPLRLPDVVAIARDVAAAVDSAHQNGVLHRDIKPANVLLETGKAMVCDFGVARAVEVASGDSFSSSGLAIGTPAYMSPEQATGGEVDARSDIYGLGCVVYEMLTGEPPFTGASAQAILARQVAEPPRSLATVRPDVPPSVERALLLALEKDPGRRPARAGLLAEMLT